MSEWISIDDRLPQTDFEVLVCCDDDVSISVFRSGYVEGDYWFDIEIERGWNITHWMPLPKPPEESQ